MADQITLNVEGRRVKVDAGFRDLSPEEQQATVEEIARGLNLGPEGNGDRNPMAQVNRGIADTVGGLVDFVNPFDQPHALNPFPGGTGSAQEALVQGMEAVGVDVAQGDPQTLGQSFARGAGNAAGALVPAGAATRALSGAGGLLGGVAGDAARALGTGRGAISELLAGGAARTAEDAAGRAGAPGWAQTTAGLVGGVATGAVPYVAARTPTALGARRLGSAVKAATMPYTETGAREVARQRVQQLAGSEERAAELARRIAEGSEIGLTPAQRTADPNMLALEQTAARQSPDLRARLDQGTRDSIGRADARVRDMGGDVEVAQGFFEQRRADARRTIQGHVDRATGGALRPAARNAESVNSERVVDQVREAERLADVEERRLWDAVPRGAQVGTESARRVANDLIGSTPRAQQDDIPAKVRELLGEGSNSAFSDFETVAEMHGLYSELRRIARSAMAGSDQNRNRARIANAVADAILDDLGANAALGDIGKSVDAARAYSAARHEIFDRGTVGRLLKRTLDGDTQVDGRLALDRSVGRGGTSGMVGYEDLTRAAESDEMGRAIEDYLASRFDRAAFRADGTFNPTGAQNFLRDNAETLERLPYLRDSLAEAARTQSRAAAVSGRASRVLSDMDNPGRSRTAAFVQAAPENAVEEVFKARRPSLEARNLAATARKDETGAALDGLKAAFGNHLIRRSTAPSGLSGTRMAEFLASPERRLALAQVFDAQELQRLDSIAAELGKLETAQRAAPDIGALSNRSPNRIIEMVARIVAARQGAQAGGGGGGSIQTAQMASGRVKALLGNLQNDKAEKLLMDAVEDPELFRLLLVDPGRVSLTPDQVNRLAPYFTGAVSGTAEDQDPDDRILRQGDFPAEQAARENPTEMISRMLLNNQPKPTGTGNAAIAQALLSGNPTQSLQPLMRRDLVEALTRPGVR